MKCEFSETQFVFGVMNELVDRCCAKGKGWAAPFYPTQRQEKNLGYDVSIRGNVCSLFFQFKIPEKLTRSNSKYWDEYMEPYFEFKIWPDSLTHQHNDLIKLALADSRNRVYYCSPCFHTNVQYEENYQQGKISKQSIYVVCKKLNTISGNIEHNITYTYNTRNTPYMHSEKFLAEALDIEELWENIENVDTYSSVRECLIRIAEHFSIEISQDDSENKTYEKIAHYLLREKNLFMVLIGDI